MKRFHDNRLYKSFQEAYKASGEYIQEKSELVDDFDTIYSFANQVLTECFPSDFESLKKVLWFPIIEAQLELEYSLLLARAGVYKTAYMCLRNFLELSLICFHYLLMSKAKGNKWIKGHVSTPFKRDILNVLFSNQDFQKFEQHICVKTKIDSAYCNLSNICHTRGQPCSHTAFSKANFPRLIKESLQTYVITTKDVIDVVITCFVGVNPSILFPVPVQEKFGINGPMSGFLEDHQVEVLRKLLKPETLKYLLAYYESDPGVISVREYFDKLPDISEEKFKKQLEDFDRTIEEMAGKTVQHLDKSRE